MQFIKAERWHESFRVEVLSPLFLANELPSHLFRFSLSEYFYILDLLLLYIDIHHDHVLEFLVFTESS